MPLLDCIFKVAPEPTRKSSDYLSSSDLTAKDEVSQEFNFEKWAQVLNDDNRSGGLTLVNADLPDFSDCNLYSDVISWNRACCICVNLTEGLLSEMPPC